MGAVLAICGCGPRLEVALRHPESAGVSLAALAGPAPRSAVLLAAVDLLLRSAQLTPRGLREVVVTRGPGSFTGIRVALATAQGIARGAGAAARAFGSLPVQAARSPLPAVLAVQPARRGEVFAQPFRRQGGVPCPAGEARVVPLAALREAELPVVGPPGLDLPAGAPAAPVAATAAEALLELAAACPGVEEHALVPLYLQPPAAVPIATGV